MVGNTPNRVSLIYNTLEDSKLQCMKKLLFLVLIVTSHGAVAQFNADSLLSIWEDINQEDTIRTKAYSQLIWKGFLFSKPDTAYSMCETLRVFAFESNLPIWQAEARKMQGISFYLKGDILKALTYYEMEYAINLELNDSFRISNSIGNMARVYSDRGKQDIALEMYLSEINVFKNALTDERLSYTYYNIGVIYQEMNRHEDALEFISKGLASAQKGNVKRAIGLNYSGFAESYKALGNYKKASEYLRKSIAITRQIGDMRGYTTGLMTLGEIQIIEGALDSAVANFNHALHIAQEMKDKTMQCAAFVRLGKVQLQMGKLSLAESNATSSLIIAQKIERPVSVNNSARLLKEIFWEQGMAKQALEMYELEVAMSDTMKSTKLTQQIAEADFEKAQYLKKQDELEFARINAEKISRRNGIQYSIIGTVILLIFGLLIILVRIKPPQWVIELMVFLPFLILFEFMLVVSDPIIETLSDGIPILKLTFNVLIAAAIFPLHGFFERFLKAKLLKR